MNDWLYCEYEKCIEPNYNDSYEYQSVNGAVQYKRHITFIHVVVDSVAPTQTYSHYGSQWGRLEVIRIHEARFRSQAELYFQLEFCEHRSER